ncbi:MAG: CoA transferase subunit A [Elusimicrobiota bacterium]|jgi:acetate CoA/acetoacetate CoA-transferase alpha subunit
MKRICTAKEAVQDVRDGASIMVGGFMCCGGPSGLMDALLEKGVKDLTLICNDAGLPDKGIGKLVVAGRVKHLIASHIGLNPAAGQKMHSGEMKVELVPQGTLAERIRAAGAGLGGVLTPTGLGTEVEKGKRIVEVDGKQFLLETPLRADFAMLSANEADRYGNAYVAKSARNFNPIMAMASDRVIVEAARVVEPGQIDPDRVNIPCVFVTDVVRGGRHG